MGIKLLGFAGALIGSRILSFGQVFGAIQHAGNYSHPDEKPDSMRYFSVRTKVSWP